MRYVIQMLLSGVAAMTVMNHATIPPCSSQPDPQLRNIRSVDDIKKWSQLKQKEREKTDPYQRYLAAGNLAEKGGDIQLAERNYYGALLSAKLPKGIQETVIDNEKMRQEGALVALTALTTAYLQKGDYANAKRLCQSVLIPWGTKLWGANSDRVKILQNINKNVLSIESSMAKLKNMQGQSSSSSP